MLLPGRSGLLIKSAGLSMIEKARVPLANMLITTVGSPGSGKTTFCNYFFEKSEILSPELVREEFLKSSQAIELFKSSNLLLEKITEEKLALGFRTVVDRTNFSPGQIQSLKKIAEREKVKFITILFDTHPAYISKIDMSWRSRANFFEYFSQSFTNDEFFQSFDDLTINAKQASWRVVSSPKLFKMFFEKKYEGIKIIRDIGEFRKNEENFFYIFFPEQSFNLNKNHEESLINFIYNCTSSGKGVYLVNRAEAKALNLKMVQDTRIRTILRYGKSHALLNKLLLCRSSFCRDMLSTDEDIFTFKPVEVDMVLLNSIKSEYKNARIALECDNVNFQSFDLSSEVTLRWPELST